MGFGMKGVGCSAWGLGCGPVVHSPRAQAAPVGFGVWGLWFVVWGLGFGVWCLGFGVVVWVSGFGI